MRVTHVTKQLDIIAGPGTTKLLEALIDYIECRQVNMPGSVDLKFTVEDDHGIRQTITARLDSIPVQIADLNADNRPVIGYKFRAIKGDDIVDIEYYLHEIFEKFRGDIRDHTENLSEYRQRLLRQ